MANNESHSLKEAVGNDSEYIFAVGTNDGLKVGEGKLFEQPVININKERKIKFFLFPLKKERRKNIKIIINSIITI